MHNKAQIVNQHKIFTTCLYSKKVGMNSCVPLIKVNYYYVSQLLFQTNWCEQHTTCISLWKKLSPCWNYMVDNQKIKFAKLVPGSCTRRWKISGTLDFDPANIVVCKAMS